MAKNIIENRRMWKTVLLGFILVFAVLLMGCSSTTTESGNTSGSAMTSKNRQLDTSMASGDSQVTNLTTENSQTDSSTINETHSSSTSSTGNNTESSSSSSKVVHDTYDDGYDDIYYDDNYDVDRYNSDSDYATGVDDAMDDMGEDW